jgi:hypothetical protein
MTPPDYLDPPWDDAGDPQSWKFYVSDLDMVTWLDKTVEERERLAREAVEKLEAR